MILDSTNAVTVTAMNLRKLDSLSLVSDHSFIHLDRATICMATSRKTLAVHLLSSSFDRLPYLKS